MKKHVLIAATAILSIAAAATPASAAQFLFTFAGTGSSGGTPSAIVGSGTFTTLDTANANGGFLITSTVGTASFGGVSGTFSGPVNYLSADNLLFANGDPKLSATGTSVALSNGLRVNLSYDAGSYRLAGDIFPSTALTSFTVTPVAAVPEPASWAMMIGGFGLAGGMLRTRTTRRAVAA